MEIYNTNEIRGDRFVYVRPGEDHPEYGAVVLKYETDEEGNFIMRDIGHMEDFATAVMVLNEILLPRMKL